MPNLILTRNRKQSIEIQVRNREPIIVTVVAIKKTGGVRLAIQAPPDVKVHRSEVAEAIRMGLSKEQAVSLRKEMGE
jgi:carbon storage regulator CsrA